MFFLDELLLSLEILVFFVLLASLLSLLLLFFNQQAAIVRDCKLILQLLEMNELGGYQPITATISIDQDDSHKVICITISSYHFIVAI